MLRSLASYFRQHHVGVLALFVALSGTAYAATLPRHSVGTAQLKRNAVTAPKIKKGAVTRSKIRNNAVTGAKVKDGSLTGAEVTDSSLTGSDLNVATLPKVPAAGTADSAATAGVANSAATAGSADSLVRGDVNATTVTNLGGDVVAPEVSCDAGFKGISAGLRVQDPSDQFLVDLYPVDLDTWGAHVRSDSTGGNATLYIVCGKVDTVTLP
jgi:hypothetical protein